MNRTVRVSQRPEASGPLELLAQAAVCQPVQEVGTEVGSSAETVYAISLAPHLKMLADI